MITINVQKGNHKYKLEIEPDRSLLEILNDHNLNINSSCGGKGTCGKCTVEVENEGLVMSCQYKVLAPVSVTVPETGEMQIFSGLNPDARNVVNNSGLRLVRSEEKTELLYKNRLLDSIPPDPDAETHIYGLAVDVGTTTIAIYLINLINYELAGSCSFLNPQGGYGADVISRIEYCIREESGTQRLQEVLLKGINDSVASLCNKLKINKNDIYLVSVVGNTVMQHLLLSVNPRPIAFAPFTPVFTDEKNIKASNSGLNINSAGIMTVLPSSS